MADVFVTYSRRNREFVRKLADALEARGRSVWVDLEDIVPSASWMAEVRSAIAAADSVLIVLSPDWVASEVCQAEMGYAAELSKRMVPVVAQEVDPAAVDPRVADLSWLSFGAEDQFTADVSRLVDARRVREPH